jgi:hypothetical protein
MAEHVPGGRPAGRAHLEPCGEDSDDAPKGYRVEKADGCEKVVLTP